MSHNPRNCFVIVVVVVVACVVVFVAAILGHVVVGVIIGPRNLTFKFGQKEFSNCWEVVVVVIDDIDVVVLDVVFDPET